jgi:hypothetical protein
MTGPHALVRSRWAAIGAAIAVTLGAGGLVTTFAADTPSDFVPITPCRLLDTRPGSSNVGPRSTPLRPNDIHTQRVIGTNGQCTVPAGATAVAMNVTVVGGTAASFLTVFPADLATPPLASSLNWQAGQAPTPNKVDVQLSPSGAIKLYNLAGTVDVLADVVGYYQPTAAGPAGPAGPRGLSAWDVIPSGTTIAGNFRVEGVVPSTAAAGATAQAIERIDFGAVAPVGLTTLDVNTGGTGGDVDPECTGTAIAPTAPPGKVCIYGAVGGSSTFTTLIGVASSLSTHGFEIRVTSAPVGAGSNAGSRFFFNGTWAYTAP